MSPTITCEKMVLFVSCFKNNLLTINIVKFTCTKVRGKSTQIRLNLPKYQILPCLFCKFELTVFMGIFCHKKWFNSTGLNDCYIWSFNCNLQPNFTISFFSMLVNNIMLWHHFHINSKVVIFCWWQHIICCYSVFAPVFSKYL